MRSDDKILFSERATCTIRQAVEATGLSRSSLYQLIADERLLTTKVGRRRLVIVSSLLALVGADRIPEPGDLEQSPDPRQKREKGC